MNANQKRYLKVAFLSVVVSLLIGAVFILILGKNPLTAYYNLLQGCGMAPKGKYGGGKSMLTDLSSYVDFLTPMLFAALSCAVAMKTGLFNIGISGQMLAAGFMATVTVGYSNLPAAAAKPLAVLVGMLTGLLVGALIGALKYKFNINEVVSSIMLNYIIRYVTSFFIQTRYVDPISRQSTPINENARLTLHQVLIGGFKYDLPLGFILAIVAMIVVKFMMDHTDFGFELKATGINRTAARYAGVDVRRAIIVSMAISGALAGIAGVTYYLGYFASIQPKVLISTGFDAIAVCLLGSSEPAGIFVAAFLVEIIEKGATYMSSQSGLESEMADVITGLILLTSACNAFFMQKMARRDEAKAARVAEGTSKAAGAPEAAEIPGNSASQNDAKTQEEKKETEENKKEEQA